MELDEAITRLNEAIACECDGERSRQFIDDLKLVVAAAEAGRWRPITEEEPAPHGVPVLLCSPPCITHPDGWEYEAGPASGGRRDAWGSTIWFHGTATHWRPLPPAPEA